MTAKRRQNRQQAQINQLVAALARLNAPARPSTSQLRSRPARRRASRKKPSAVAMDGQISITRSEILAVLTLPASKASQVGHVDLVPDSFGFLKGLAAQFDRLKWNSMRVYYKPAVGTTYGGLVSVGMDWDFVSEDVERVKVSSFTPNFTTPAWGDTEAKPMVLPASRLMSRAWYTPGKGDWIDKGPGKLHWAVTGTSSTASQTVGELWVHYSATLQGTNPA